MTFSDPFRWLEDTNAPETAAWIAEQNVRTAERLDAIGQREEIRARLTEIWDHPTDGAPFERGGTWFQWRNSGLQDQPVLHADDRVLLDPNGLSPDGTTSVGEATPSPDGSLLAYCLQEAGSDWLTWHVRDVSTGDDRTDVLRWSKFSGAAWRHDGSAVFYGRMPAPTPGQEHLESDRGLSIWEHRIGTDQSADVEVFPAPAARDLFPSAEVSDDGRWLIVTMEEGTRPEQEVHLLDLTDPQAAWIPLVPERLSTARVITVVGETFLVETSWQAERSRIVATDLADPSREAWRDVVPQSADVLTDARRSGDELLVHLLHDAQARLVRHALDGSVIAEVPLPECSSILELRTRRSTDVAHLVTTSFTDPRSLWSLRAGELALATSADDAGGLTTTQVFVPSDDGTVQIPVFLVHRSDIRPTGDVRVLLYGYGGFMVPMTPGYSPERRLWVERGGLLAVACLRGGGEYGTAWHDAGRREHKQNVFDDFAACARWLVAEGWTRPDRIGLLGRSNGGLLVGASLTQHPELFGAAVPEVGVLDMLRFHLFTIGWAWTSDFGDPDVPEERAWLEAYSPLHHVSAEVTYPPTLITTGDHDDRVAPGHSFKLAATLQAAGAPAWIRVDVAAGHGAGKPTSKLIAERTDVLAFLEDALS